MIMNPIQTLLVDLIPTQGSSIIACVRLRFPQPHEFHRFLLLSEQRRPLFYGRGHSVRYEPHTRLATGLADPAACTQRKSTSNQ